MPYRAWSERRARPRTYVGQWLRAALLRQTELRKEREVTLNDGPGWKNDEPAVVEFVCQVVLRRLMGEEYDESDITKIVDDLIRGTKGRSPVDPLQVEAIIRDALGEAGTDVKDINPRQKLRLRYLILIAVTGPVFALNFDEAAIDAIITDSERMAFEHGWKPPLIRDRKR